MFSQLTIAGVAQQCFSGRGCTGGVVEDAGPSASDCCVGTEGQSYGSPGACTIHQCIGIRFGLQVNCIICGCLMSFYMPA